MKKALKIIFLSFLCVVGALGLLVGGMYLFGGFEEKDVYADNLSFSVSEIVSNEPFALKITTTTAEVNKKNLKLSVLAGGESVIDFPTQVEIDEIFTVIPKQVSGTNFGGNVTLVATYDYENSNQSVKAYCEIMIDVPVNTLQIKKDPITTTLKQNILLAGKDTKVSDVFGVNPTNSLMPYVEFGTQKVTEIVDKKLYLQLVYKNQENVVLEKNVARFLIDGVVQDKEFIEVGYSYKDVLGNGNKEIVFNNNISVETYEKQEEVYIKAYLYSTYKDQNYNTQEGVVSLNKNTMVSAKLAMAIGDYEITNMTIDEEDREVYLNEDSYIYLNNSSVNGNDINLNMQLETGSPGIPANDFYLLNSYIKIDNEPYRLLTNNLGQSDAVDGWVPINYEDISKLEKDEWRWKLNINNFLAYKNGTPLKVTVKFDYYDEEKDKTTIFERTFNIIVKINQVESVEVSYPENKTAFNIASGETLNLVGKFDSTPSIAQNSKYAFDLYLSYSENYENGKTTISTVPTSKITYKVKFDFVVDDTTYDNYVLNVDRAASNKWCDINEVKFTQKATVERSYFVDYKSGTTNGENRFEPNKAISVEAVVVLKAQPTEEELFFINYEYAGETVDTCSITNFMAKFYELVDTANNTYSDIPYLSVDSVRYYVDFDYYLDDVTLTRYLKINSDLTTTNSYKVQGIGTIYVTAQLVYKEDNVSYWLDKSATAKVEIFEEIKGVSAFEYIDGGNGATYNNAFSIAEINENEKDADGNAIYRYIFITSNEINSLKNYIGSSYLEIYAKQIFSLDETENDRIINSYANIENINSDAIKFEGEWIPVIVNDVIVGYRIAYTIGEVFDIEIDEEILQNKFIIEVRVKVNGEYVYAKFLVNNGSGEVEQNYLNVNIKNIILQTAEINYNGTNYGYSEDGNTFNPFEIYANVKNGNEVYYKTVSGSSDVDFNNLKYFFKYNDTTKQNTTQTLIATFDAVDVDSTGKTINMTNGGAYYSFEKSEDGAGGLVFKNVPRFENGVVVKMTIKSETPLEFNTRYVYNQSKGKFEQVIYEDELTAEFYFRIYGLVVDIKANEKTVYGAKDGEFLMLGTSTDNSAFEVAVKSYNPNAAEPTTCQISNYLDLINISINNDDLFKKDDNKALIYNEKGSALTFNEDVLKDTDVPIMFYIGDASTSSLIYIDVNGEKLSSYSQKITSPFEVSFVNKFSAPSKDNTFVTILYKTESFDNFDPATLEAKTKEAKQKALEKLNINIEFIDCTLDASYNISNPIAISDVLLNFKAVPTVDETKAAYTANMLVVLSLKDGGAPLEITKNISVFSSILASNIVIGNYVDAGEDSYYYIDAGQEYFVDNSETAENEGVVISGELKDNFKNVKNIEFNFEDISYQVDANVNVEASAHMVVTPFDSTTKNFGIMSEDLNYQKTIKVIFTISFEDGGKTIISKNVVVKPNLFMKLSVTSYKEGQDINLTQSVLFSRDNGSTYQSLDILLYFDYEDTSSKYNKNSFEFNSQAFRDKSSVVEFEYFIVAVQSGASALDEEQRVITFNYVADGGYILVYNFVVSITAY